MKTCSHRNLLNISTFLDPGSHDQILPQLYPNRPRGPTNPGPICGLDLYRSFSVARLMAETRGFFFGNPLLARFSGCIETHHRMSWKTRTMVESQDTQANVVKHSQAHMLQQVKVQHSEKNTMFYLCFLIQMSCIYRYSIYRQHTGKN